MKFACNSDHSDCPSVSTRDFLRVAAKTFARWQIVHCG